MDQVKVGVVAALQKRFPSHELTASQLSVMHRGRFANAIVFRYQDDAHDLVIKDYSHCPPIIRQAFGRATIRREVRTLEKLQGMPGIVAEKHLLGPITLSYPHIAGTPLSELRHTDRRLPAAFFHEMEEMVQEMHQRGVVHLDLRNLGNILHGDDERPYFIDFQSALDLSRAPGKLRPFLRHADLSGVYKSWLALCDAPLPTDKRRILDNFNRIRRFWIFRGYPLSSGRKHDKPGDDVGSERRVSP